MHGEPLEQVVPARFGGWQEIDIGQVVLPREDGSLEAKLYSEVLSRIYGNEETNGLVMLALAYGDTQSDLLQLHRPESCYPAFGFELSDFRQTAVELPLGASIPASSMIATAPGRTEAVTYWTRLGEYLPTSQADQRLDKLRMAMAGIVPDGMLVRCSTIGTDSERNFAMNEQFLTDLVLAIEPQKRPAFIGTRLSERLASVHVA